MGTKPPTLSDHDYISDEGLEKIAALAPKVAQDFDLQVNAFPKTVQATFKWTRAADVFARGDSIYALADAAMWLDALCKNLRAERDSAIVRYEVTDAGTQAGSVMLVPRSFVESVLYSGSFDGEQLDQLHRQAEELLA